MSFSCFVNAPTACVGCADGIADEVYEVAPNRGMREYSLGAFLQSAHAIHMDRCRILNAASPQLVEASASVHAGFHLA